MEDILSQLINKYSILDILIALKKLSIEAAKTRTAFSWEEDTDAIVAAIERLNN